MSAFDGDKRGKRALTPEEQRREAEQMEELSVFRAVGGLVAAAAGGGLVFVLGAGAVQLVVTATLNRWFVATRGRATTLYIGLSFLQLAVPAVLEPGIRALGWRSVYPGLRLHVLSEPRRP